MFVFDDTVIYNEICMYVYTYNMQYTYICIQYTFSFLNITLLSIQSEANADILMAQKYTF